MMDVLETSWFLSLGKLFLLFQLSSHIALMTTFSIVRNPIPASISTFANVLTTCRAPDTAKIKAKMVYAGSKDALTRALVGVSTKISASDLSELTEDVVVEACKKFA